MLADLETWGGLDWHQRDVECKKALRSRVDVASVAGPEALL